MSKRVIAILIIFILAIGIGYVLGKNIRNDQAESENTEASQLSSADFEISGVKLGMKKSEVLSKLGGENEKPFKTDVDGNFYSNIIYNNIGLYILFKHETEEGDGTVVQINIQGDNSKTARGLGISSTKQEVLNAFRKENILENAFYPKGTFQDEADNEGSIVVGYEDSSLSGYDERGKIVFTLVDDKVVDVQIYYGEK